MEQRQFATDILTGMLEFIVFVFKDLAEPHIWMMP